MPVPKVLFKFSGFQVAVLEAETRPYRIDQNMIAGRLFHYVFSPISFGMMGDVNDRLLSMDIYLYTILISATSARSKRSRQTKRALRQFEQTGGNPGR